MGKKKSFLFSFGNSSEGPIGFCARIDADTRKEAIALMKVKLKDRIQELIEVETGDEYVTVYFNPNYKITDKDIEEEDDI